MAIFLMTLLISHFSWADTYIAIYQNNKLMNLNSDRVLKCWDNMEVFDKDLCEIVEKNYKCEREFEFNVTRSEYFYETKSEKGKHYRKIESNNNRNFIFNPNQNTFGYHTFADLRQDHVIEGFSKISSVKLKGSPDKDMTRLFKVRGRHITYSDDNTFKSFFKPLSTSSTIVIKGECTKYKSRVPLSEYAVYAEPRKDSELIGRIITYKDSSSENSQRKSIAIGRSGHEENELELNLKSPMGSLSQVNEVEGSFINVGEGVWGKSGWSEIPFVKMFSGQPIYFQGPDDTIIEFFKEGIDTYYKRVIPKNLASDKENLSSGEVFPALKSEIFGENETLKLPVVEISPYNRNTSDIPALVKFIDGDFLTNGPTANKRILLYSDKFTGSSLLGFIEFEFDQNHLSAYFIDKNNKKTKYIPDYFLGRCGKELRFSAFHNAIEINDLFSQIGPGPWGEKAWVKEPRHLITERRLPIKFMFNNRVIDHIEFFDKLILEFYPKFGGISESVAKDIRLKMDRERHLPTQIRMNISEVEMDKKLLLEHSCQESRVVALKDYELLYTDLLFNTISTTEMHHNCRNDKDPSRFPYCKVEENRCDGYFYNEDAFKKAELTLSLDKKVGRLAFQMNGELYTHFNWGNRIETQVGQFLYPSKINIYAINSTLEEGDVFHNKKPFAAEDKRNNVEVAFFKANINNEKESIKLSFPEKLINVPVKLTGFENELFIKIFIGNSLVLPFFSSNKNIVLKLTEGTFPLRFEYISDKKTFVFKKNIIINSTRTIPPLTISLAEFTPALPARYLSKASSVDKVLTYGKDRRKASYHYQNSSLVEDGSVKDLTAEITSTDAEMRFIDPEVGKSAQNILNRQAYSFIKTEGVCRVVEPHLLVQKFNVHTSPSDNSPLLGYIENEHRINSYGSQVNFIGFDKKKSLLEPLMSDECSDNEIESVGRRRSYLLLGAKHQKGEWIELGAGPWGLLGFMKGASHSIFDGKFDYRISDEDPVRLKSFQDNAIEVLKIKKNEKELIPIHYFFTAEGKLKNTFSCHAEEVSKGRR